MDVSVIFIELFVVISWEKKRDKKNDASTLMDEHLARRNCRRSTIDFFFGGLYPRSGLAGALF